MYASKAKIYLNGAPCKYTSYPQVRDYFPRYNMVKYSSGLTHKYSIRLERLARSKH
jgi:hypothetical protein